MARAADIHLCVKVPKKPARWGWRRPPNTTAALVMGDALAVALLEARGFTPEDFALSHPAARARAQTAAAGQRYYAHRDEIPHVSKEASLRDALLEITRKTRA